ncbi:DUF1761 domain-containing protein [Poseidonocella sedimentorum]|uniref:DUF1761 domain-containing protein n=1 Tax=Poseidonocella sedimentorum TaxID=871652 RepID=A0A1I6D8S8_9RHOB|nr:DUF1761 domain-containing protein [Poseidonocella sedimentorum]SFR01880.1 Protein of unknown function [Poseidonocella sedimentorum]
MGVVSVIAAGAAAWVFGAIWYSVLAQAWKEASGVALGEDGAPVNQKNPVPYIASMVCMIVVAGMIRHIFAGTGITTLGAGGLAGLGAGLFIAAPWIVTCYGFAGRPLKLILIDGGYATFGCMVIGIVLTLF